MKAGGQAAARVAVCIVTYDSEADLPGALAAVAELESEGSLELVVADCGSRDGSVALARAFSAPGVATRVVPLGENRGFAGGMNAAIEACAAPWILALNPDARPRPDFLAALLARGRTAEAGVAAGSLTGRLVRPEDDGGERRLDACGMVLRRSWRHLDRGSGEVDRGQYAEAELVFGGTGAATLYRREALLDVAFADGQIFDTMFHSYREDAELAFRLQERGWACIYEPAAVAEHRRTVLPQGRGQVSPFINYHSLKNRYLLRAYHQSAGNFLRTLVPALLRDLGALAWVLAREHTSLPAYSWLWRNRRGILERRRYLRARKKNDAEVWFRRESLPLP
jgi:GT2 family glycosyltransferase